MYFLVRLVAIVSRVRSRGLSKSLLFELFIISTLSIVKGKVFILSGSGEGSMACSFWCI